MIKYNWLEINCECLRQQSLFFSFQSKKKSTYFWEFNYAYFLKINSLQINK